MTIEHLARDLRYGARGLWRDRSFTVTTVATLSVAMALVAVVFTIFNAYVLRPYAVRDPYSLHEVRWRWKEFRNGGVTRWGESGRTFRWSDYQALAERRDLFDSVIAERNRPVSSDGRPILAAFVTGNYFEALGGRVMHGRALAEFDASPDRDAVAVLSHDAWTRLFDGDPAAIGRTIHLNDQTVSVVGVMHREFTGLNDTPPDLWLPVTLHRTVIEQDLTGANQPRELAVVARLRRGTSAAQAAEALAPVMPELTGRTPPVAAELLLQATPAPLTLELLAVLSPVFVAFLLVLFAACANVSNVMLARANARHREIAMRLSLGASRTRVVCQLLTEGLLISALAGSAALGIASLLLRAGVNLLFLTLPPSAAAVIRVVPLDFDHRVFLFTLVVAAAATVMFALLPALQATRVTLTSALRGELGAGVRASAVRNALVVGQVAASLVLIIVATTLVRNGMALQGTDVGFETRGLLSITQRSGGESLIPRAFDALASDPRIAQAAVTSRNPLLGELPKTHLRTDVGVFPMSYMFVSPGYFPTLGISVVRGRVFGPDEARAEAQVAIVSASAARMLWPGADPIGKVVRVWIQPESRPDVVTRHELRSQSEVAEQSTAVVIVGVATDIVSEMVYQGRNTAHLYLPTHPAGPHAKALIARGRSLRDARPEAMREVLRQVDANPLAFETLQLEEALALQMFPLRVASWVGMVLSAIALVLAVSGLYGVVTYGLSQRRREIGIRMALGATPRALVGSLMTQSAWLVGTGTALGVAISFTVMAVLRAMVQFANVSLLDAGAFALAVAVVSLAATMAAYFPSRAAAMSDPAQTLRADP